MDKDPGLEWANAILRRRHLGHRQYHGHYRPGSRERSDVHRRCLQRAALRMGGYPCEADWLAAKVHSIRLSQMQIVFSCLSLYHTKDSDYIFVKFDIKSG